MKQDLIYQSGGGTLRGRVVWQGGRGWLVIEGMTGTTPNGELVAIVTDTVTKDLLTGLNADGFYEFWAPKGVILHFEFGATGGGLTAAYVLGDA